MSKERFMAAHERLVEEYMEENPDADWSDAYERTADKAYQRMLDDMADAADFERKRRMEERMIDRLAAPGGKG
jgi:hypothetical protein